MYFSEILDNLQDQKEKKGGRIIRESYKITQISSTHHPL